MQPLGMQSCLPVLKPCLSHSIVTAFAAVLRRNNTVLCQSQPDMVSALIRLNFALVLAETRLSLAQSLLKSDAALHVSAETVSNLIHCRQKPILHNLCRNQTQPCVCLHKPYPTLCGVCRSQIYPCMVSAGTKSNLARCLHNPEPSCMTSAGTSCCGRPRSCPTPATATQRRVHMPA